MIVGTAARAVFAALLKVTRRSTCGVGRRDDDRRDVEGQKWQVETQTNRSMQSEEPRCGTARYRKNSKDCRDGEELFQGRKVQRRLAEVDDNHQTTLTPRSGCWYC